MLIWSADVEMTSTVDTALYRRGVAGDVVPYFYVAPERAPEAIE
jgi:hypothetical protein